MNDFTDDIGMTKSRTEKAKDAVIGATHKVSDVAHDVTAKVGHVAADATHVVAEQARYAGAKVGEGTKTATDYAKAHPGIVAGALGALAAAGAAIFGAKMYREGKRKEAARAELDKVGFPEMRAGTPNVDMDRGN